MNSTLRKILLIVNTLALVASILWAISNPDYEPIISCLVLCATMVGLFITDNPKKKSLIQRQSSGNDSVNIQAGRDIKS
jgi:uncharacterized membrane protein